MHALATPIQTRDVLCCVLEHRARAFFLHRHRTGFSLMCKQAFLKSIGGPGRRRVGSVLKRMCWVADALAPNAALPHLPLLPRKEEKEDEEEQGLCSPNLFYTKSFSHGHVDSPQASPCGCKQKKNARVSPLAGRFDAQERPLFLAVLTKKKHLQRNSTIII